MADDSAPPPKRRQLVNKGRARNPASTLSPAASSPPLTATLARRRRAAPSSGLVHVSSSRHACTVLQRERTRKLYTDDWTIGDEEIEGRRSFQLDEKIEGDRYDLSNFNGLFREMTGPELNLTYLQKHGLQIPLLFKEKSGLGLRVPSTNFSVNDVRTCVGK